jgi:hypothetical protein
MVAHHIPPGTPLSPAPADSEFTLKFPTPEIDPFTEPTTLVDCHGWILIWYLPGILDSAAKVSCIWTKIQIPADAP